MLWIYIIIFIILIIVLTISIIVYRKSKFSTIFNYLPEEKELVIARCEENIDWVNNYIDKYSKITIYNKCNNMNHNIKPNKKIIFVTLPNIGSCDYAYLTYIIDRYHDLPKCIEFIKGSQRPYNKISNTFYGENELLYIPHRNYNHIKNFKYNNHIFGNHPNRTHSFIASNYKNMGDWLHKHDILNDHDVKNRVKHIIFGGHFITTRWNILRSSKDFWLSLRNQQLYPNEEIDHYIERLWGMILTKEPKYKLGVLAIFKNEAVAMSEWLEHYRNEGVEHFYLINNGSTDSFRHKVTASDITLYDNDKRHAQVEHYNYFLDKIKTECEWIAVVDLDEFIYARLEYKTIPEYLDTLSDTIGAVEINWKMFGSNGHIKQPASIIEGFFKRQLNMHQNVKSICRTKYLNSFGIHSSVHSGKTIKFSNQNEKLVSQAPLHLNHYAIQSWEWFKNIKMTRGSANVLKHDHVRNKNYFDLYDKNEIEDTELKYKIY